MTWAENILGVRDAVMTTLSNGKLKDKIKYTKLVPRKFPAGALQMLDVDMVPETYHRCEHVINFELKVYANLGDIDQSDAQVFMLAGDAATALDNNRNLVVDGQAYCQELYVTKVGRSEEVEDNERAAVRMVTFNAVTYFKIGE